MTRLIGAHRLLVGSLAVIVLGAVIGVLVWGLPSSGSGDPAASAGSSAASCPTTAAVTRSKTAVARSQARFLLEARGVVIHSDLRQIAHDRVLIEALGAHDTQLALAEANRQLVRHVVRIRVLDGARVILDANSTSFDVGGSSLQLRGADGRVLGRLEITVQDIIGFDKLVHKLIHANVVVRSSRGRMRTTLPAAGRIPLPRSGCARVGARTFVVRSFAERGFARERLTIWILTPA